MKLREERNDTLTWFLGFAEGNQGSWQTYEPHKKSIFLIYQEQPEVLLKIQKLVGYGQVTGPYEKENGSTYYRYWVGDLEGTRALIKIFNGNLVLKRPQKRFSTYLEMYNTNVSKDKQISLNTNNPLPTSEDAWFSGFVDAAGSFSGTPEWDEASQQYIMDFLKFRIEKPQENEIFLHLKTVFGGEVKYDITEMSSLIVSSGKETNFLIRYLSKYPLYSHTRIPFIRFKEYFLSITRAQFK